MDDFIRHVDRRKPHYTGDGDMSIRVREKNLNRIRYMDNQRIMAAGFVGGLVAAVLNSIPILNFINCFCCAGIMLGGAVALVYYDRSITTR